MKRVFQKFGFRQTPYDRPNQKWVCGRECQGDPCGFGPDLAGRCTVTYECKPVLQGNRWMCNRARAGTDLKACEPGPTPEGRCCRRLPRCNPVLSLRAKRGLVVLCVSALALGGLLLLMTNQVGSRFVTPGELSHAHSSAESRCQDCHTAGAGLAVDWLHAMKMDTVAPESSKCIACHPMGEQPLNPHSLPLAELGEIRKRVLADHGNTGRQVPTGLRLAALGFLPNQLREGPVRCAACHVEHQGKEHDLKQLGNTQCQVCHSVQFSDFAHGHPGFGDYPFTRPTRIVFDHERHLKLHFKEGAYEKIAPQDCLSCHVLDDRGEMAVTRGYERSCAGCHAKEFSGNDENGPAIAFLRVPLMDVEGFDGEGIAVGEWPDDWDSLETTLTPFTQLLLAADSKMSGLVTKLGANDLDILDDDAFADGGKLAWALKELLHELAAGGVQSLRKRIAGAIGRNLTVTEAGELERLIPPEVFGTTVGGWFPRLDRELKAWREGAAPEAAFMDADEMEERLSLDPKPLGGRWIRSDTDLTLYYRPGHHGDPFMKLWLELMAGSGVRGASNQVVELEQSLSGNSQQVAPGRCMKCHTAEPAATSRAVNWRGARPDPVEHRFSRFSHVAHFSLLDESGCVSCHRLNFGTEEARYLDSFSYHGGDSSDRHVSNFKAIEKATCAACHTSTRAGESCLNCHNYHVGQFESTRVTEPPLSAIGARESNP